jgi:outer membrane murein-binding lipoprotein Lpp
MALPNRPLGRVFLTNFMKLFLLSCVVGLSNITAFAADTNGPPMPPTNSQAEIETLHARISQLEAKINRLAQIPRENTVPQKALSDVASAHYELAGKVEQLSQQVVSFVGTGGTNTPISSHTKFTATCPYCQNLNVKSILVRSNGGRVDGNGVSQEWTVTFKCRKCKETFFASEHSFVRSVRPKREQ